MPIKLVIIFIIIKATKLSIFYLNKYFILRSNTYFESDDKSDLKEYPKCIEKYLTPQDRYITIVFCELSGDKLVTKGTYAKMARGERNPSLEIAIRLVHYLKVPVEDIFQVED